MSTTSYLLTEDQFLCSICLDVFTHPVTIPCGHNFCRKCITTHWEINPPCQCPNCKKVFNTKPELHINTLLSEMVVQFRKSSQNKTKTFEQMIQKRRLRIEEIKQSVELNNNKVEREMAEGVQVLNTFIETAEKCLNNYINTVKEKQRETQKQAEGFIKELQQEISELEKRSSEVEQLSRSEDHLLISQPIKVWSPGVHPPSYVGTLMRAVKQLEETLRERMKTLIEADLKRVQQYEVDLILDPETANLKLILSDDGKRVHHSDFKRDLPDNPERFDSASCVLAMQSFSSGRFYYEVYVGGKTKWDLGVAKESITRKGNITLSPQNGYWTICLRNAHEYTACAGPGVRLFLQSGPEKVGVFVDYEEGLVSFYDAKAAALLYSFTGCSFTKKIYPYFSPGPNTSGKNSAPLVISSCHRM
ncbi:E3 ubiquitin-protein ligase TRIM21-like [Halichoeres trimaculatus]|uniref:E3 ubiquitin-protein ligase TRIM21-like n=1 Tax=Halichoeres trimaculatus TaxID=147232 RepID=UPI003D9E8A0F